MGGFIYTVVDLTSIFEEKYGQTIAVDLISTQPKSPFENYSSQHRAGVEMDEPDSWIFMSWQAI